MNTTNPDMERLIFRRQFIWGRQKIEGPYWNVHEFGLDSFLSCHSDLALEIRQQGDKSLAILGTCYDPFEPYLTCADIAERLVTNCNHLNDLIACSAPLSGRWAILFIHNHDAFLFNDPCGFRSVYYSDLGACGSDPNILKHILPLEIDNDADLKAFLADPRYEIDESAWIGPKTLYKNCSHLLPNHVLNLNTFKPKRFFPTKRIAPLPVPQIIDQAVNILEGSIEALLNRSELYIPLTAGWDSRVLLAASRQFKDKINFYIDTLGVLQKNHPDIVVAQTLAETFDLKFSVVDSSTAVPDWFFKILNQNISRARNLPKTRTIYNKSGKTFLNVNGNVSEICRNFFDSHFDLGTNFSAEKLNMIFSEKNSVHSKNILEEWLSSFDPTLGYHVLDLLYWEQRLGNWGAHFPAEQDISIEEVSPFNCRKLLTSMLASPRNLRTYPDYPLYKMLIEAMWPETLSFPINPPIPTPLPQKIRRLLSSIRYRCTTGLRRKDR